MALLALALYALYLWRLKRLASSYRDLLAAKNAERERIARDLHDTLLQSTEGLVLLVQAASSTLPEDSPQRPLFDKALARASALIAEGRDRVQGLRGSGTNVANLLDALTQLGRRMAEDYAATVAVTTAGKPRQLHLAVCDEMWMIAREALLNACHHGKARTVTVCITYDSKAVQMLIADDGQGIDTSMLAAWAAQGHWGVRGMHERAARIGGELVIRARDAGGTEVALTLPAARAYASAAPGTPLR